MAVHLTYIAALIIQHIDYVLILPYMHCHHRRQFLCYCICIGNNQR